MQKSLLKTNAIAANPAAAAVKLVASFLIIKSKAMNTNKKHMPNCCESGSICCGNGGGCC